MSHISKLGYCRYQMTQVPENWETPVEILNGYAVQFEFDYVWNESNTECTLSNIKWAPGQVIYKNGIRTFEKGTKIISEDENQTVSWDEENPLEFSTEGFKQSNLTITVNNQTKLENGIIYQQQNLSLDEDTFTVMSNFLTVNFSYVYLDAETNITYSVIIPDIRILKVSKYDKNVVFTYDGMNEFLQGIKNYPIIDIDFIDAYQQDGNNNIWSYYTNGQPCIKVSYGNGTKNISYENGAQTSGYKYVPVGSNIKFLQISNPENYLSPLPENDIENIAQSTGTFRVKINTDIFEVPIAGLAGGTGEAINFSGDLLPTEDDQYDIGKVADNNFYSHYNKQDSNSNYDENQEYYTYVPFIISNDSPLQEEKDYYYYDNITNSYVIIDDINNIDPSENIYEKNIPPFVKVNNLSQADFEGNPLLYYTYNENQDFPTEINDFQDWIYDGQTIFYKQPSFRWKNLYLSNSLGDLNNPVPEGYFDKINIGGVEIGGDNSSGNTNAPTDSLLGKNGWTNKLTTPLEFGEMIDTDENESTPNEFISYVKISNNANDGIKQGTDGNNGFDSDYTGSYIGDTTASIYTKGGIYAEKNIIAERVFNAVFNDYAECRSTINLTPGHVVIDKDDGSLACSSTRLQPGAQVISDTYGHLMGGTDKAKTPIAVAGRVLVYTYQPRENYHAGMAVCSAPDGTVDVMTREEIRDYPDCIVGIVSEIPQYEIWGSDNVKVDGRIWIKVK